MQTNDAPNAWVNAGVAYPNGKRTAFSITHGVFCARPPVHQEHWEQHNNYLIYEYDPTDDGPEVEVIVSIRINHPELPSRRAC